MKQHKLFAASISFILAVVLFISFSGSVSAQTASSSDLSCTPFSTRLQRGSRGSYVVWLQQVLGRYLGTSVDADGVFGRGTLKYVSDFQSSEGLEADGVVGAQTRAALIAWCGKNPTKPTLGSGTNLYPSYDSQFTLRPGQQATFNDGMNIILSRIVDSRCDYSNGRNCFWAGEISTTMRVTGGAFGNSAQQIQLGTSTKPNTTISGYTFTLVNGDRNQVSLRVTSNNGGGVTKTVYVGEEFTTRTGDWVNLSGQSIKLKVESLYSNSCHMDSNAVCTAVYMPVAKINAILGGDVALPVPVLEIGKAVTLYNNLSITLKEVSMANGTARLVINSTNNNNATPVISSSYVDSIATDTARLTMYVDTSKYSSSHVGYFIYSTANSSSATITPNASYSNGAYTYILTGLTPSTTYSFTPIVKYRDESQYTQEVKGSSKSFTTEAANVGPGVRTDSGTSVTATTATLNGYAASLSGYSSSKIYFQYGTSVDSMNYSTPEKPAVEGSYTANLTELTPNTTYYFRAVINMGDGRYRYGSNSAFTTTGENTASTVTVRTDAATSVETTGAMLNGYVTGLPSYYTTNNVEKMFFQYGTTTSLGSSTAEQPGNNGTFSASLSGLTANTTYYFRSVVKFGNGTYKYGSTLNFKTNAVVDPNASMSVQTLAATNISSKSATLNGSAAGIPAYFAENNVEKVYFQYGLGSGFSTSTKEVGAYNGDFSETISGLTSGTYSFRAVLKLGNGTLKYGTTMTFSTSREDGR